MKKRKYLFALSALLLLGLPLASCGGEDTPTVPVDPTPGPDDGGDDPVTPDPGGDDDPVDLTKVASFEVSLSGSGEIYAGESVYISCTAENAKGEAVTGNYTYQVTAGGNFIEVDTNGKITGKAPGQGTVTVRVRNGVEGLEPKTVTIKVLEAPERAVGAFNYVGKSYEEKLDILGKLEKYVVDNHLTGITLFQNGGYVMYSSRISKPTNNYITGYGFGILTEGNITKPMTAEQESNEAWREYYHSYAGTNNKQKFNYLDDDGSESSDLYSYVASTLYNTKMNATRDGYEYFPHLAKPSPKTTVYNGKTITAYEDKDAEKGKVRPIALNKNSLGLASKYRVYVRTGKSDGIAYNTLSDRTYDFVDQKGENKQGYSFKGRLLELEDYITPYRVLLNGKIHLKRMTDMISDTSESTLKGAKAYNSASAGNSNIDQTKQTFDNMVGLKSGEDTYGEYLDFEFNQQLTAFSAMQAVSSSLVSPFPADFIRAIAPDKSDANIYQSGMKDAYGTVNKTDPAITPVDNLLSVGPYVLEQSASQYNVYKKNELYKEWDANNQLLSGRYNIKGLKLMYLQGAASDTNLAFTNYFLKDMIDACSIPKDYITEYVNDARTTKTEGSSTFKLNVNSSTQEEWNDRFKDPKKTATYNATGSYKVKPLMSNDKFLNALSFAIDRKTFAENRGNIPSQEYFAPAYLWEPELGKSYNETPQHKAVLADYSPSTYGYNVELAVQLFDAAIKEEVEVNGSYTGYKSTEEIKISWMNTTDPKEYGNDIIGFWNTAFEKTNAYKAGFRINFTQDSGNSDYQVVYDTMRSGMFDLGFGSISGMTSDPLGFMEVLKSDNSSGFTLNYGMDTAAINEDGSNAIIYDGKEWSFDGLWAAAKTGAIIGTDSKTVANPVTVKQAGTGTSNFTVNGTACQRIAFDLEVAAAAQQAAFKIYENDEVKNEAYVTASISYKKGSATETVAVNFYYGDDAKTNFFAPRSVGATESDVDLNGYFGKNVEEPIARFYVNIPMVLTPENTNGQITNNIEWKDITGLNLTVTYYMEIEGIAVASSLTTQDISRSNQ